MSGAGGGIIGEVAEPSGAGPDERMLVALDIDGTVMHEDGRIAEAVVAEIHRAVAAGHEVMLATGRSVASTLPVLDKLAITPDFVVCCNGAITLRRDAEAPTGYSRDLVETFDPTDVLTTIRSHLDDARYAVEDEDGYFRYTDAFPDATLGLDSEQVPFEELLNGRATRVVVIAPDRDMEEFLGVVERMGLHKVSYAIGWTAWLDIAPDGVNKSTALERVRELLGVTRENVVAMGDGRNDIDMLAWAGESGRGYAMGQAPADVKSVASAIAPSVDDDGVARVIAGLLTAR